jgi:AraC family transcriptional regulator
MLKDASTERLGYAFGLNTPHTVGRCISGIHASAIMEVHHEDTGDFFSHPLACDDAYLVFLNLEQVSSCEVWLNGRSLGELNPAVGGTRIFHLAEDFAIRVHGPFHALALYIPQELIGAMADEHRKVDVRAPERILGRPGKDPVIQGIGHCMLPIMQEYSPLRQPFVDYLLMSLGSHLLHNYGETQRPAAALPIRGLAPWQERRAKELMQANLQDKVSLDLLAKSCRLSSSAFAKGFKESTGTTPYQWFISRRVEYAMQLMCDEKLSLMDIGLQAGFADQSHFTRVFAEKIGMSPGVWRSGRRRVTAKQEGGDSAMAYDESSITANGIQIAVENAGVGHDLT